MVQDNKKLNVTFKSIALYAAYSVLIVLSTVFMTESRGILRTLPFVLVVPALATFLVNKKLVTVFLCFAITLCFGGIESEIVAEMLFAAVAAGVFSGLGIMAKRFFITARVADKNNILFAFIGAILLILGCVAYAFMFGTPHQAISASSKNAEYIKNTYADTAPEIRYTHYDFKTGKYYTNVGFVDETYMNADISLSGGEVYDGYSNYYEYKMLSQRRNEMSKLLSQHFTENQFALRINMDATDIFARAQDAEAPESFYGSMVFDLAFYSQLREKEDFIEQCRKCSEFLKSTGAQFASINYYGGFADEFLYEMSVPCGFDGDYASLVKDFSGETFDRYYKESDYIDGWSYGR